MPNAMTPVDKDKDLEPVRPAVEVADKDEKKTSQEGNPVVESGLTNPELSPREMIYKKHDEQHRPVTEVETPETGLDEEQVPKVPVAEPELNTELEAEAQKKKPGPKPQVEVRVNGNTRKVDKAKVDEAGGVEAYQMMVAGQEKLRLISQREKAVKEKEAALEEQRKELEKSTLAAPAEEPAQTQNPDLAAPVEDQQSKLRRKAKEALLDGDVEEADRLDAQADDLLITKASTNAIQHMEQTQAQREETQRIADAKLAAEQRRLAIDAGTADFAIEYPELMRDPHLMRVADSHTDAIVQEHPEWNPSQVMLEAGKRVTDWVKSQGASNAPSSLEQKAQEKRSMVSPQAGSQRSPRKPEPQPQTASSYVQGLQKRRGQIPA